MNPCCYSVCRTAQWNSHCLVLQKRREASKEKKEFLSNTSSCSFPTGQRLLSLKSVFDLKECGHPNSLGNSDNLSHFIKKPPKEKGISGQPLPNSGINMTLIILLADVRSLKSHSAFEFQDQNISYLQLL